MNRKQFANELANWMNKIEFQPVRDTELIVNDKWMRADSETEINQVKFAATKSGHLSEAHTLW